MRVCVCVCVAVDNTPFLALRLPGVEVAPSLSGVCDEFSSAHNWLKERENKGRRDGNTKQRRIKGVRVCEREREKERIPCSTNRRSKGF